MKIYPIFTEFVYVDSRDQQQRNLVETHQTATTLIDYLTTSISKLMGMERHFPAADLSQSDQHAQHHRL